VLKFPPFFTPFFLALRNMDSRRWRTALTLMGIVLGVAVVLAIRITNQSTLDSIRGVFDRATGKASLIVVPRNQSRDILNDEILSRVDGAEGVVVTAPSIRASTILASQADSWRIQFNVGGIAEGTVLVMYGIDPALDHEVHVYEITAGRMPDPERYEVALPVKYAEENGFELMDDLEILVPEGTTRLRIVGLLEDEGIALYNDGAVAFTPLVVVQDLFDRGGELDEIAIQVQGAYSDNPNALEALKERLNQRVKPVGEVVYPAARGQLVSQMLATYQLGLTFFSMIAIFVGSFLIYNTFSMTVVERTREIGMLRAIGMSRGYITRMVLAEALVLALFGSALGILVGVILARGLIVLAGEVVVNSGETFNLPLTGLLQSLAVGIGMTLIAALIPAVQAARISPLEALRARGRSGERVSNWVWISGVLLFLAGWLAIFVIPWRQGVIFPVGVTAIMLALLGATLTVTFAIGWLERISRPLASALYGNEGAIGSANVSRSVSRTTLTVACLMVSLTMIISIDSLSYSFEEDMSSWIESALGGDLYVRSPVVMRESFARQLENVPGVQVVSPGRYLRIRSAPGALPADSEADDTLFFNAIDPDSHRLVADVEFAPGQGDPEANWAQLSAGKAVFVSTLVAEQYDLEQGDEIRLLTSRGEQAFIVAAEIVDFAGEGYTLTGIYEDMRRWFGENGADRFTIKVAPGYDVESVGEEINGRFEDSKHISVQTMESFKEGILEVMSGAFRLFDVLNLIGVIIGALGVINTLTMNVLERQREIGGLRSLGMTRGQTLRMVLAEALALGLLGAIYGLGFGYLMAHIVVRGTNMLMNYDLVYLFTPRPFIIGVLIALFIAQLAAISPARRAAGVNIVSAIKQD
jgi:putative ABC transport system permease protein